MHYFDIDGFNMAYELSGEGDQTLVFLHGFGCNRSFMAGQMAHFSNGCQVVNLDFLGHGDSNKPKRPYRIPLFAADTIRLLEYLKLNHVVLVGHSMGGAIAIQIAADRPDMVQAVASLDTTVVSPPGRKTSTLPAMLEALKEKNYQDAVHRFSNGMFQTGDGKEFKARIQGIMAATPRHVLLEMAKGLIEWEGPPLLKRLACPFLYIGSSMPLTGQADIIALGRHNQYAQVAGSGHFLTMLVPGQVNAMLERWLELLPIPGE